MIPEFITAKPATNRNAAETQPVPDTNSADPLQNEAAFQKALHERTSEQPAEQQAVSANNVRPEESSRPTSPQTSNESSRETFLRTRQVLPGMRSQAARPAPRIRPRLKHHALT